MLSLLSTRSTAQPLTRPVLPPSPSSFPSPQMSPPGPAGPEARDAAPPVGEHGWHDLWWRAGSGHEGPWGLRVRALQADHPALAPCLAVLPARRLVAVNTAGCLQALSRETHARLQPHGTPAWAWAFAVEQRGSTGTWDRSVCMFDRRRQPLLSLQLDPHQPPDTFYALAERCGSLALRPPGLDPVGAAATAPPPADAHLLPASALPDLLTRAAQAGLALQLRLHLAGADVHLALRPQGLQAGRHHLHINAHGCSWQLPDSPLHTLWWLPAATPGSSPCLQLRDGAGLALATLGAAPRADGRRPCGWQTLMADALTED